MGSNCLERQMVGKHIKNLIIHKTSQFWNQQWWKIDIWTALVLLIRVEQAGWKTTDWHLDGASIIDPGQQAYTPVPGHALLACNVYYVMKRLLNLLPSCEFSGGVLGTAPRGLDYKMFCLFCDAFKPETCLCLSDMWMCTWFGRLHPLDWRSWCSAPCCVALRPLDLHIWCLVCSVALHILQAENFVEGDGRC